MTDEWRYRCPRGHTSWVSRDSGYVESQGRYYCRSCQLSHDDGPFDKLVDVADPDPEHVADPEVEVV